MRLRLADKILIVGIALLPLVSFALPKAYTKGGTASNVNATIQLGFNPSAMDICNDSTTIDMFIDFTDGVAVADNDGTTNIKILKQECHHFVFQDRDINKDLAVGVITAASTAAYRIEAVR